MNIETVYDRKPGRVDGPKPFPFDWEAYPEDYDPERDPIGYGSTEEEAIRDLLDKVGRPPEGET